MMPPHSLRGSTGLTSIRIFCPILLRCLCYNVTQNVLSSSVGGNDCLSQMSSKFVQYSCEEKDVGTGQTSGQRDIVKT